MHSGRDTQGVVCRYFKQGNCLRGSSCLFSHDLRTENICRYFLQGTCAYGDRCRYDHVRPSSLSNAANQSNPSQLNVAKISSSPSPSFTPSVNSSSSNGASAWLSSSSSKTTSSQSPPTSYNLLSSPSAVASNQTSLADTPLCPYGVHNGSCTVPNCSYLHGDKCDVCELLILHPYNEQLRQEHKTLCMQLIEEDLHYSFAMEASKDKVCGICLEIVLEKDPPSERKFGILDACDHVFCLKCIMAWRANGTDTFSREAVKSCPECRRNARFIMKSDYWCDTPDAKKSLVDKWMANAKKKPCKFWKSEGYCRFADKCFFSHDGTPGQRRRRLQNDRGVFVDQSQQFDFVTLLLEATRRNNVNPSSLLFSLSDDDSDDVSFDATEDYLTSFADRGTHVFLPEFDDGEEDDDDTATSDDNDWTTDDENTNGDIVHWNPVGFSTTTAAASASNLPTSGSSHQNQPSLFDQPD